MPERRNKPKTIPNIRSQTRMRLEIAGVEIDPDLAQKLQRVKLLLCDVDGVLTDGSVFIGGETEVKRFSIHDGFGLLLLKGEGVRVGWISNRHSIVTTIRAAELQVDFLVQGKGTKLAAAQEILDSAKVDFEEVAYAGDDILDLALMKRVGVVFSVPDAAEEARQLAHYISRAPGGDGAVREMAELILKAQNKWARVIRQYSK
jgi:3-deoxy-D-manno-octulosonate 8-phosphate phosphatase (KDO 8-P phosphatase)